MFNPSPREQHFFAFRKERAVMNLLLILCSFSVTESKGRSRGWIAEVRGWIAEVEASFTDSLPKSYGLYLCNLTSNL